MISSVAAAAHAPFVSAASPKLFDLDSFTELAEPRDLAKIFESVEYATWTSFRESEDSRYVGLTLPRVLGRLPYGEDFKPVEEFNFEEDVDGKDHDKYLWMNAAWAYATRITDAFAKYGWTGRDPRRRGRRQGRGPAGPHLPDRRGRRGHEVPDRDRHHRPPRDRAVEPRLPPAVHCKDTDYAVFMGAQSCQKPKTVRHRPANANAELSTKFAVPCSPVRASPTT